MTICQEVWYIYHLVGTQGGPTRIPIVCACRAMMAFSNERGIYRMLGDACVQYAPFQTNGVRQCSRCVHSSA